MNDVAIPTAIPQATPVAAVKNQPSPAASDPHDPALLGFHKVAAQVRSQLDTPPVPVPFGTETLRIHASMPAGFAFDAAAAEADPFAAKRLLREAFIPEDQTRFDEIMKLPPTGPTAVINGEGIVGFLEQLGKFYAAVPLGG
jgi:hypothetical protein